MKKKRNLNGSSILLTIITVFFIITFLTPIIWALATSLKVEGSSIKNAWDWFSPPYTLENYTNVIFSSKLLRWLWNSVLVAVITTVAGVAITIMAGYAIAKIPFKGKGIVYFYLIIGMMVPSEATIVPLFITANSLNLIDTYSGLILPVLVSSMNLIIVVTFIKAIPKDLIEAAQIDGAGYFRTFISLIAPLSQTVIVTVSIFTFMGSWNNYLWPLLSAMSEEMFTLPIGIPTFINTYSVDFSAPMAAAMVASIPAIIIFLIFEKKIVQGVALSGIKG